MGHFIAGGIFLAENERLMSRIERPLRRVAGLGETERVTAESGGPGGRIFFSPGIVELYSALWHSCRVKLNDPRGEDGLSRARLMPSVPGGLVPTGVNIYIYFIVEMTPRRASRASSGFRRGVEIPTVFSFARGQKWLRLFCFCAGDIA